MAAAAGRTQRAAVPRQHGHGRDLPDLLLLALLLLPLRRPPRMHPPLVRALPLLKMHTHAFRPSGAAAGAATQGATRRPRSRTAGPRHMHGRRRRANEREETAEVGSCHCRFRRRLRGTPRRRRQCCCCCCICMHRQRRRQETQRQQTSAAAAAAHATRQVREAGDAAARIRRPVAAETATAAAVAPAPALAAVLGKRRLGRLRDPARPRPQRMRRTKRCSRLQPSGSPPQQQRRWQQQQQQHLKCRALLHPRQPQCLAIDAPVSSLPPAPQTPRRSSPGRRVRKGPAAACACCCAQRRAEGAVAAAAAGQQQQQLCSRSRSRRRQRSCPRRRRRRR